MCIYIIVNLVPPNQIQHARSHPALHVQLGTCLHRPQYLGFLVHRHLVWVDRALEHYQHMATQTKPKCPSCTCTCTCSFPVVFNTLSGWNTKITIHIFTLVAEPAKSGTTPLLKPCRNLRRDLRHRAQQLLVANLSMSRTTLCRASTIP